MALFDRRRNGRIDPDEWEAARRAAEKQVRRQQWRQATEPDVHVLADTGDPARPFIIAAFREEGRLIRYFQWRAAGCLLAGLAGLAPALGLGTLNVKYRDVGQVAPVLVRIGMFVTPVMYDAAIVPERWRLLYRLNPMVGVVDGFRWCVLGPAFEPHWPSLVASASLALIAFVGGLYYLRYYEKSFADVV